MIKQLKKQGVHIIDIAHQLECSERTVRRNLTLQTPPDGKPNPQKPSKLDLFKPTIDQQLEDNVWNAEVIFHILKEKGYDGGRTLLRSYIQPKRVQRPSKKTVRFETAPGEQLQHDWGELFTQIGEQKVKVYIAVNALGYSRRFHVWGADSLDAEHTYQSLIESFHYFGGVPKTVLVDNQKAAVKHHKPGGEVIFNEGFLKLAEHYDFIPKACRPLRPQTKGKTERMVGYVKHHFFERYQSFESFAHLNQLLVLWLGEVAEQRVLRQFNQTPAARFEHERATLQPLPDCDFDTRYYEVRQVTWDAFIEVRGNRYSVPEAYCQHQVTVRISMDGELSVYDVDEQLIVQHRLQGIAHGWVVNAEHHSPLWASAGRVEQRDLTEYEEIVP